MAVNKSDLAAIGEHDLTGGPRRPECGLPCRHPRSPGRASPTLRERILAMATGGAAAEPGMLTSLRHHQAITTARPALADAARANANSIPHEMILIDLYRGALGARFAYRADHSG